MAFAVSANPELAQLIDPGHPRLSTDMDLRDRLPRLVAVTAPGLSAASVAVLDSACRRHPYMSRSWLAFCYRSRNLHTQEMKWLAHVG